MNTIVKTGRNEISIVTVGEVGPAGPSGGGSGDLANTAPLMNGAAAAGVFANASRGDHVHPSDTSRAPASHVGSSGAAHANVVAAGASGFMTGADKSKLDGLAAVAMTGAYVDLSGRPTLGTLAPVSYPGGTSAFLRADGTWTMPPGGGSGDVVGPSSSVNARVPTFSGTTGKLIQDSGVLISQLATNAAISTVGFSGLYGDLLSRPTLATVATTGVYSDLTSKPTLGTLAAISYPGGTSGFLRADGNFVAPTGSGDVVGPAVAVSGRVATFSGTTGKLIQDSGLTLSGSNTGDQTTITGNAGTATTLATGRLIDGQSFNGSADITVIAPGTFAATAKTTPIDADVLPLVDSAASNVLKKVSWLNIKATLKTYFDTLYAVLASPTFSGVPAAPTATAGTNTTQLATTAFVAAATALKMTNPMTTSQDLIVGGASGAPVRLGVGVNGNVLTVTAGAMGWVAPSGGGSALWSAGTFSVSVPFTQAAWMPNQIVSSVFAFTPNTTGAAAGGSNYVRLIADGINAPTFTGFTEHGSSAGYDNRNNYPNYITFWFDGTTYWYSIQQAAVPVPIGDTTAPVLSTAVIGNGTPTVVTLTYNESLTTTPVPATTAFTVGGTLGTAKTVSSISITGAVVSLTCSSAFISTDTPTITYTVPGTNPVRDLAGNSAAALTAQAVTNNVAAGATILRFATLASMAESGNGTTGWIYTASAVFTTSQASGPSKTLASAADGSYSGTSPTTGATTQSLMGLKTAATAGDYTTYNYGIYANGPSVYRTITAGAGGGIPNGTALAPANGDIVRMRRTGTSIFAEVSKDSGATFTILNTWTGASTAQLWPIISTDTGLAFGPFTSIGMT